jgi:uncharacterized linocin/CFP29 family protein
MTTPAEFFADTHSATPRCDAEIEKLRKHYPILTLTVVFALARKLEMELIQSNNSIVDLLNQIEAIEEKNQQ